MSVAVSPMEAQDVDAVLLLASANSAAPQWNRAAYDAIVTPSGAVRRFAFVARYKEALGGFAVAGWLPREADAEVETVVVDTQYRRLGLGSALLRACMLAASQAGAVSIRLEVRASNAPALGLYRENGFASTGIRRSYYSTPMEDAVLLQRPL